MINRKYITYMLLGFLIVTLIVLLSAFINNKKESDEYEQNNIVTGVSCGEKCLEYSVDFEENKDLVLEYNTEDMDMVINISKIETYELNIDVLVNGAKVFETVDFTTHVKIFEFQDIYVVEYVQSMTQCGNTIDILINKSGSVIEIPVSDMDDTYVDETNYEVLPSIMKTEFIEDTGSIVVYKESCSMCPSGEYQIGFKYTYSLENGLLKLQNRENIYCND